ncbi:MAG: hypothetical protein ACXWP5_00490 [Bdellovibrionota bacterium]
MRTFLLTLLILCGSSNWAFAHSCEGMPEGFHEWAAFGHKTVYLYHFPMFGSIHSYQVLVSAELKVEGKSADDQFFALQKANPQAALVISPAKAGDGEPDYWVLPEYSHVGASFLAKLHFHDEASKKDVVLLDHVQVTVRSVILKRLMNSPKTPADAAPRNLEYFYFGTPEEAYLAHKATWDPDFDQILEIAPIQHPAPSPLLLAIDERGNQEAARLKPGEALAGRTGDGARIDLNAVHELFEYKIDLQH